MNKEKRPISHICNAECKITCNLCPHGLEFGDYRCGWEECLEFCRHGKKENCEDCEADKEWERTRNDDENDLALAQGWSPYGGAL